MNKSLALGLVIGLGVGLISGALVAKSRKAEPKAPVVVAPPAAPPPAPPVAPKEPAPDPELEALRARVTDLEAKLAEKSKPAPSPDSTTAESPPAKPAWIEKLDAMLKKGLEGYKGEGFDELVQELKKHGKEALDALKDRLLNAESASERFMAAALMEDLGDPAAIPALAQALGKDDDLLVRRMSSHAIAMIRNEAGLASLRAAMSEDTDWGVRVNSAYGVAKLNQPDGVKMLEDSYKADSTPAEYKLGVFGALADVGAASSVPIFRKILTESTDITYLYLAIGAVQKLKDATFVSDLNRIAADGKYSANVREMAKKAAESLAK